ncbi:hypothetical protein [Candidatus Regiella insecticola]|uniref:hypothetical protein n=1 Tax=Candidatus Regiella insecticola TaxID=138073 RepID=UPI001596C0D4|nr:hypothetical protein [Candidatus Regiella insecticola]
MREYGVIRTRFWSNTDVQKLSDQAKLLAVYLLTGPHCTMLGFFRLPMGYLAEDLAWHPEVALEGFNALTQINFLTRDPTLDWIFIHHFLKWNPIENPNQGKCIHKLFNQVPPHSQVFYPLIEALLTQTKYLNPAFRSHLETLLKSSKNQDQKQDQDHKQDREIRNPPPKNSRLPDNIHRVSSVHQTKELSHTTEDFMTVLLKDGSEFTIDANHIENWQKLYPTVDGSGTVVKSFQVFAKGEVAIMTTDDQ